MATTNKKAFGNRKFYSLPEDYALRAAKPRASTGVKKPEDTAKLLKYIDDNVIGKNATFASPFGRRKVVYCDYTASGRSLQFLEDYILKEVLPSYGNTHTTTSITSLQSTLYRHEARDIFRNAVNASEHDAVIFAGHGCTGAVHKLVQALNLVVPAVVFVGPCEHHSNLLPWRELGATIVRVRETRDGQLDLADLESGLQAFFGQGRQLIGCFSAASNVTGILADDIAPTVLLHRYGALAFWDFAAAAPYVKIDMNPVEAPGAAKDAVFFSVHKFVGGVQTPGVLIAKKSLFRNTVPNGCGGGTVFFVTRDSHRYLQDTELREEGGTAAVVESVRAGLAMQLKEAVGVSAILSREEKMTRTVLAHCRTIPELVLLGPTSGSHKRLPIFSFMVKHPRGTFLHHNFVCMVLNDVFGIQARGGCACAGPYAQDLLGIDADLAQEYENMLLEDSRLDRTHLRRHEEHSSYEMLRPGFARISLPYFMPDAELAFVLEAIKMVATEGWKLLPQYIVNPETGEWRHHTNLTFKERKWLGAVRYVDGKMSVSERRVSGAGAFPPDYAECLRTARGICNRARKMAQRCPLPDQNVMFEGNAEHLRWFMLPSEAQDLLLGHSQNVKTAVPFDPSLPLTPRQLSPRHSYNLLDTQPPSVTSQRLSMDSQQQFVTTQCNLSQISNSQRLSLDPQETQQLLVNTQCHLTQNPLNSQRLSMDPLDTQQLLVNTQCHILDMQGNSLDMQRLSIDAQQLLFSAQCQQIDAQRQQTNTQCYQIEPQCYQMEPQCYQTDPQRQFLSAGPAELSRSLSHSPVHFALGDSANAHVPRFTQIPRERCCSLGADATFSLPAEIAVTHSDETVLCDSSSQTDLKDMDRCLGTNRVTRHSSSMEGFLGGSTVDGISAYVREITKDIATEIKSEIREVISQVEDVLSETMDNGDHHDRAKPPVEKQKGGSVSVSDVMDYLMECSREMASEVKSEIRSAVDVLNSPDAEHHFTHGRLADLAHSSEGSSDETVVLKCRPMDKRGKRAVINVESKTDDTDTEESHTSSVENKQCALMRSNINSISSQDSGINLVFPESDNVSTASQDEKPRKRKLNLSVSSPADNGKPTNGVRGTRWHCPPKAIWKPAVEALHEFGMIRDGDRVLVCLSGGKDSLSLLHTLRQFQFYARAKGVDFTLGAATVDPGSSAYDPRPLIPYLAALGVHYLYEEQPILEQAAALPSACSSVCSFCSRMKRGRLYAAARANGYNVLALGQHLDDLVESFFMSAFHNGRLRSMKAHYLIRERDLRVIRPFVYVREKALRQFAESRNLPVIAENCPACFEAPKERFRSKQLLAQQEVIFPKLFWSLRTALHPLICFRKTGEEALVFSRQHRAARALALAPLPQDGSDTDEEEA